MTEQETSESASKADTPTAADDGKASPDDAPIPFRQFLEAVHPSVEKNISDVWYVKRFQSGGTLSLVAVPDVRLHCPRCEGERWFRSVDEHKVEGKKSAHVMFLNYFCSDCRRYRKSFSLWITIKEAMGLGVAYKYGEHPLFSIPVPNKVLRLFGEDRDNFIKGRQCENQGLGVGAFAYYRRVVENHKNEIFDEIIKVCETLGALQELIDELRSAQKAVSFTKAMAQIKTALPQGLLINGQDPLVALHGALSVGLHDESDAKCLEAAHDVRLVLTDLIEKMSLLRQDNSELHGAVQRLIAKKGGGRPI